MTPNSSAAPSPSSRERGQVYGDRHGNLQATGLPSGNRNGYRAMTSTESAMDDQERQDRIDYLSLLLATTEEMAERGRIWAEIEDLKAERSNG